MNESFMTEKEKSYVNHMLGKTARYFKSDIDFNFIINFNGEKAFYEKSDLNHKVNVVFGKEIYGSKKQRLFCDSENHKVKLNFEIEMLITKFKFKKYYKNEIVENSLDFKKYLSNKRIWKYFDTIFLTINIQEVKEIFYLMLNNHNILSDCSEFINKWYDKIPSFELSEIPIDFGNKCLINRTNSILSMCLLINNPNLKNFFFQNFILQSEIALLNNEIWDMLTILYKFCNIKQKEEILKISQDKLREYCKKDCVSNFVKCLSKENKLF